MSRVKIVLKELFWGFGKPKSKFQRRFRLANRSLAVVGLLFLGLALFPQVLFAHSYSYENYTVYSQTPLPPETEAGLKRADSLLQRSDLFSRNTQHDIFLCNNNALFNLFYARNARNAYAFTPITRKIFIQHGSIADDWCWKSIDPKAVRSFSSLVAHEVTHNLVRERLGTIGAERLATWKNEGYAEYISLWNQEAYEQQLVEGREGFKPGKVSAKYQPYLDRILDAFEDDEAITFEDVLKLD